MKSLTCILLSTFIAVISANHCYSQNWEAFLEKHVDNIINADPIPGLAVQYSQEAIMLKKSEMLSLIYNREASFYNKPTGNNDPGKYPTNSIYGKDRMSSMNATLSIGTENRKQNARYLMYNAMLYHGMDGQGRGVDFTSFYIAGYIQNLKPESFTSEKLIDLRNFYADIQGGNFGQWGTRFWTYNTENHCQMFRSTTYGVGLKWPDHNFIVRGNGTRETGTYMYNQIEQKHIFNYFPYLLKYGMGENLSPVYMGPHTRPWTVFYELANHYEREPARAVSGAVLEYYYALLGLNSQHNMHIGMVNRAKTGLRDNWNYHSVAKIYGGYGPDDVLTEGAGSLIAESSFMPHEKTRKIIAGDIRMPYSLLQTCARNNWYQREVRIEDSGASPPGFGYSPAYAKTVFRYNYVDRNYSIGSGNLKILQGDSPDYGDGIAGSATWENGSMFFSSPQRHITEKWGDKFFTDHKPGSEGNVGSDSWVGYSPYMEMAQFENTMLVYCVIPSNQAHRIAQVHISSPKTGESLSYNDHNKAWYGQYRAKEGMVYIGIIPMHYNRDNHKSSGFLNTERIIDDGSGDDGHCGYVVEMAHSSEMSFVEFKSRVTASGMIWDKGSATLSYTNRRGHNISLTHSSQTSRTDRLPTIKISPVGEEQVTVDWESYPVLRSPYMRVIHADDREKLIINDNEEGVMIDFDGDQLDYLNTDEYVPENRIVEEYFSQPDSFDIVLHFIEEKSGEDIVNTAVLVNEVEYMTDGQGMVMVAGLDYGSYSLQLDHEGHDVFQRDIEVFRDSSYVFYVREKIPDVVLQVIDRANGNSVSRALIDFNGVVLNTTTSGILNIPGFEEQVMNIKIEHDNYFTYYDTLQIKGDTLVVLELTKKLANVSFQVMDSTGPMSNALVKMSGLESYTNFGGMAYFPTFPARNTYEYTVSRTNYMTHTGEFYLEIDTVLEVVLELSTPVENKEGINRFKVFPNPVSGHVTIESGYAEAELISLKIFNVTGNRVMAKESIGLPYTLDVSTLESGLYFIRLIYSEGFLTKKIMLK